MSEEEHSYELVCQFWIDTEAYSDRDRLMFCCGVEFQMILEHIRHNNDSLMQTIHKDNESRVRMACGKFGRTCKIEACETVHDPQGTWSYLKIEEVE